MIGSQGGEAEEIVYLLEYTYAGRFVSVISIWSGLALRSNRREDGEDALI